MTTWSYERIETLTKLLDEGLSYREIAQRLGHGLTRNAVLGKAYRMGYRYPERTPQHKRQARKRSSKAARAFRERGREPYRPKPPTPLPANDLAPTTLVTFADLSESGCRWIYGEPGKGGGFCPHDKLEGVSYCAAHQAKATAVQIKPSRRETIEVERPHQNFEFLTVRSRSKVEA